MPGTAKKLMAMSDQQIEDWRRVVENMLFSSGSVTEALRLDAQHAFAQLMQELEDSKNGTYYSSGFRAGWNDALEEIKGTLELRKLKRGTKHKHD